MIPQSFIDDLLLRVDILAVIGRYVSLKKTGANYTARCPFHEEKTPSFTVSAVKQFYHCFGCSAHGDVLRFLMDHLGVSFLEAVAQLAAACGMTVPEQSNIASYPAPMQPLWDVLQRASDFYSDCLLHTPLSTDYLKHRGITENSVERFCLGYAPAQWQNLAKIFPAYANEEALQTSGLVVDHEAGRRYDRFRERLMFPLTDDKHRVIGFGGRVLGEGTPKYLNSPETPLFMKSRELYGWSQAKAAIRHTAKVLVVEGYVDVVMLVQFGITNVVATLGTATTPEHLQKLFRHSSHLVFCFDGDLAGRKAAWRALENALPLLTDGVRVDFAFLPDNEDPDSLIRKIGRVAFERMLHECSEPLSRFMQRELWSRVADFAPAEAKSRFWHDVKPLLLQVNAVELRRALWADFRELTSARVRFSRPERVPPPPRMERRAPASVVDRIFIYLLRRPQLWVHVADSSVAQWKDYGFDEESIALLEFLQHSPSLKTLNTEAVLAGCPKWRAAWTSRLETPWGDLVDIEKEEAVLEFCAAWQSLVAKASATVYQQRLYALTKKAQSHGLESLAASERDEYRQLTVQRHALTLANLKKKP